MIRNKRNKAIKIRQGDVPYELGPKETKSFDIVVERFFVYKRPLDVETISKEATKEIEIAEKEAREEVMAAIDAKKKEKLKAAKEA